jgi:hypothetical protein
MGDDASHTGLGADSTHLPVRMIMRRFKSNQTCCLHNSWHIHKAPCSRGPFGADSHIVDACHSRLGLPTCARGALLVRAASVLAASKGLHGIGPASSMMRDCNIRTRILCSPD